MRIGLGDITPLNLPTGATEQVSQPPQGGYILGPLRRVLIHGVN